MALRHALLAALLEGEASGYDLAKGFDASVANFWPATPQQLYRELDRMAAGGLVRARLVRQEKRPDKRLFSVTEAGQEALREFTAGPPPPGGVPAEPAVPGPAPHDRAPAPAPPPTPERVARRAAH